jgi:hypothetical protein
LLNKYVQDLTAERRDLHHSVLPETIFPMQRVIVSPAVDLRNFYHVCICIFSVFFFFLRGLFLIIFQIMERCGMVAKTTRETSTFFLLFVSSCHTGRYRSAGSYVVIINCLRLVDLAPGSLVSTRPKNNSSVFETTRAFFVFVTIRGLPVLC